MKNTNRPSLYETKLDDISLLKKFDYILCKLENILTTGHRFDVYDTIINTQMLYSLRNTHIKTMTNIQTT